MIKYTMSNCIQRQALCEIKVITMNYEGLKDDALTALIHLGYLGYDAVRVAELIDLHTKLILQFAEGEDQKKHTCVIETTEQRR